MSRHRCRHAACRSRRVVSPTPCKNYRVEITEGVAISGFTPGENRYLHRVIPSICVAPILPLMRARAITGFSPKEFPVRPAADEGALDGSCCASLDRRRPAELPQCPQGRAEG